MFESMVCGFWICMFESTVCAFCICMFESTVCALCPCMFVWNCSCMHACLKKRDRWLFWSGDRIKKFASLFSPDVLWCNTFFVFLVLPQALNANKISYLLCSVSSRLVWTLFITQKIFQKKKEYKFLYGLNNASKFVIKILATWMDFSD